MWGGGESGYRGTNNNNTVLLRVFSPRFVASERQFLDTRSIFLAHDLPRLIRRDVYVLFAQLRLGGRRVDGFRKSLTVLKASGLGEAVDCAVLLVSVQEVRKVDVTSGWLTGGNVL